MCTGVDGVQAIGLDIIHAVGSDAWRSLTLGGATTPPNLARLVGAGGLEFTGEERLIFPMLAERRYETL